MTDADPLIGAVIGRYRLVRVLGQGGMGRVYEAIHPEVGSRVAIKVINEEFARDRELAERFFAEARAVNLIRHENIVSVHDLVTLPDGRPVIVMELIEGHTLRSIVREAPAPLGAVIHVMIDVLSALGAAHAAGIIHRDLKPDNILVTASGRAKVLDFGIAKLAHTMPGQLGPRTRTGAVLGTPEYMAPEQINGGDVDARTDIYALGVVLFEAVTGRRPFDGPTDFEVMRAHVDLAPPSSRALRREIPVELEGLIACALAKRPGDRFANANAMANALYGVSKLLGAEQWGALTPHGRAYARAFAPAKPQAEVAVTAATLRARPSSSTTPRSSRRWLALGAVTIALGAGIAVVAATWSGTAPAAERVAPTAAPAAGSAVAPVSAPAPAPVAAPVSTVPTAAAPVAVSTPAAPAGGPAKRSTSVSAKADLDPKRFDASAYAPKALALARTIYPDAGFVSLTVFNVFPTGLADLGLSDRISSYEFRSPSASAPREGVPRNIDDNRECLVLVLVSPTGLDAHASADVVSSSCRAPIRPLPKCTLREIWAKAKARGADPDTIAQVSFLMKSGTWFFDNTFQDEGVALELSDGCP